MVVLQYYNTIPTQYTINKTYNVTLRRVRAIIVSVENQRVLHNLIVYL